MRGCRGSAGSCAAAVRALRQGAPARPASPALLPWRLLPSRSRPTARSRHRCGWPEQRRAVALAGVCPAVRL